MATVAKLKLPKTPDHATINWLNECLTRGENEVFSTRALIGPGVAQTLLAANPKNRALSELRVRQYAKDMANDRWTFNGEPIIVADTRELNDGQHRLQAVIESNRPQDFLLVFGIARQSRITVDQGAARTAGHYLGMEGVKNANLSAGIARMVVGYETSNGERIRSDASNADIVARVTADDNIAAAAHYAAGVQKYARGFLTSTFIGAAFYLFAEFDEAAAKEFLDQVCIGENIKRGDPAFAVRQALSGMDSAGTHTARRHAMEILFRGWIAYRQGRKLAIAKVLGFLPALV